MRPPGAVRVIALLAASLALGAVHADAQKRSPTQIRQQLEESVRLQRAALAQIGFTDLALKLTWDAYVQLRAAHSDNKLNLSYQNIKNPTHELANPRFDKARWHLLRARDILKAPDQAWSEKLPWQENASNHLRESIHQIELVVAIAF